MARLPRLADDGLGVIERERAREEKWAALNLPDPVNGVVAPERLTRALGLDGGVEGQVQAREELDPYLLAHPDERPGGW